MDYIVHIDKQKQVQFSSFFTYLGSLSQSLFPYSEKPLVRHNKTNQITYVSEGEGAVFVGNDKREISKGDVIVIAKGNAHSFATNSQLELLHYHWPKDFLNNDREIIENYFNGWKDFS